MRCNLLVASVGLTVMAVFHVTFAASADDWRAYQNERYGTTIEYPHYFRAGPPPTNNDGLEFKSQDGADFSVFASYNALDFNLAGLKDFITKNLKASEVVTHQALQRTRTLVNCQGSSRSMSSGNSSPRRSAGVHSV
jgi:hypothetical protein